jgi:hypothetical protein
MPGWQYAPVTPGYLTPPNVILRVVSYQVALAAGSFYALLPLLSATIGGGLSRYVLLAHEVSMSPTNVWRLQSYNGATYTTLGSWESQAPSTPTMSQPIVCGDLEAVGILPGGAANYNGVLYYYVQAQHGGWTSGGPG